MRRISIVVLAVFVGFFAQAAIAGDVSPDDPGWTLVRRVSHTSSTWHPTNDNLMGTSAYGTYSADPTADATWSVLFETAVTGWDQVLVSTGDKEHWIIFEKSELSKSLANGAFALLCSSLDSNAHTVLAYNRPGNPEDPWLSTQDHHTARDSEAHSMLYGENSYGGWNVWRVNHKGANVFIRNSAAVVPLPAAAWLGFGLLGLLAAARRWRRRA